MRAAYLDSSVVLRVVLGQPDNLAALLPDLEPFTSALTQVECLRALDRLRFADPLSCVWDRPIQSLPRR